MGRHFLLGREDGNSTFWIGPVKSGHDSYFPSCSDELLDWTYEASVMFQLYLQKGISRRGVYMDKNPAEDVPSAITFLPLVLKSSYETVPSIPSMTILDRIRFFAENVSTNHLPTAVIAIHTDTRPPTFYSNYTKGHNSPSCIRSQASHSSTANISQYSHCAYSISWAS